MVHHVHQQLVKPKHSTDSWKSTWGKRTMYADITEPSSPDEVQP